LIKKIFSDFALQAILNQLRKPGTTPLWREQICKIDQKKICGIQCRIRGNIAYDETFTRHLPAGGVS